MAIRTSAANGNAHNLGMPKTTRLLPERVVEARERLKWSQAELARRAGLSQPTVWSIENDQTQEVKLSTAQKLAVATGRPIEYFTGEIDRNAVPVSDVQALRVPIVSWVHAGKKTPVSDPHPPGAPEGWEEVTVRVSSGSFALKVRGDSMVAPDGSGFPEGSIIIIDPSLEAQNGDYVVVRFDNTDEATFKRLVVDGPLKLLKPLNPTYPVIHVTDDARLAGVVVEHVHRRTLR